MKDAQFYVIIEIASVGTLKERSNVLPNDEDMKRLTTLIESANDKLTESVVATDFKQFKALWNLREQVAPACVSKGFTVKYDVSLSPGDYYKLVEETRHFL